MAPAKNINQVNYRFMFFTVRDNFLCGNAEPVADINYFIQCKNNIQNKLEEFYTLLVDLSQDESKIWDQIYHRTQTEIKSFLNNSHFEYKVLQEISPAQLNEFIDLYNGFAEMKKIRSAEIRRLKAYLENGILCVSYIKQKERYVCINFYRLTAERASNLHSFHLKHLSEGEFSASHFGRAHRAIHWLDIKTFKEKGIKFYDFCGWYNGSENRQLLNINAFKEQFTNNKVLEYTGVIYKNSFLAFLKKMKSWI